jgi:uncharacterized membrane protein
MNALYVIGGAIIGLIAGEMGRSPMLGLLTGLGIGILLARLGDLRDQVTALTARLDAMQRTRTAARTAEPAPAVDQPAPRAEPGRPPGTPQAPATRPAEANDSAWATTPAAAGPTPGERALRAARDWLTTGNVPAKVGMLVSFIGVSFLLKYAIDRNLLNLPIEARLLAVAAAGAATAAIGWRLRQRRRNYALILQGGGLGVLFLTVYAALRVWQLIPEPAAFLLLAALAAATAVLAVLQEARTLAMFGIAGGFLAPVLASTGQGSHVVLFSYYLLLNVAILGIAWRRAWRGLNLLGFAFTFVIAIFWGYRYFRPELFASTEPFLVAHFLLYQAIAVLYALRRPPDRPDLVDGTIVFGTPVMAFGLQSAMLSDTEYGLAISAAALAVFYAACWAFLRRRGERLPRLLGESYLALAVAFGTVAIPLAFDARWTTAAWALEGAALVWVGTRQQRLLATAAGTLLVFAAGLFFLDGGWQRDAGLPVLNANVMGGLMVALAALFAARRLPAFAAPEKYAPAFRFAALALLGWGVAWWLGTAWTEIADRVAQPRQLHGLLLFNAASAAAAVAFGRWRGWTGLRATAAAHLPLLLVLALLALLDKGHVLYAWGGFAWPAAWVVQAGLLYDMDRRATRLAAAWHVASLFLLTAIAGLETAWRVDHVASEDWAVSAMVAVAGVAALAVWALRRRPSWPVPRHADAYLAASMALVGLQLFAMTVFSLYRPGDPAPLSYLPVLNPLGLGSVFALLTAGLALAIERSRDSDWRKPMTLAFAACAFVLTSAAIVRTVHHYTGVEWRFDTLFASERVQAALSIWWGLLGFAGMVLGARRAHRTVWFAGAACMALVLAKLFLVDLGNSGTIERIVSFIGTGALLLIVGYFAPVPPRTGREPGGPG